MNLHGGRTFEEGNTEKLRTLVPYIHHQLTLSAIAEQEHVGLQELVNSWNGYMGMNTAFTRSSKIQCLHLDRYSTDSGAPTQIDWNLNIPETVLLPIKASQEPAQVWMEYCIVGGIIHTQREGHVQAVCRNPQGWLVFDDGREPVQYDQQPPFANDWVCIWLLQRPPSYWLQGLDQITARAALEFSKHVWSVDQYPKDLLTHMAAHCLICGRMVLSFAGLQAHIRESHPEYLYVLHRSQQKQDFMKLCHSHVTDVVLKPTSVAVPGPSRTGAWLL